MLRELIKILRANDAPTSTMGHDFVRMLHLALDNTINAGNVLTHADASPSARTQIYEQDVEINQLERSIRKQVVAYLSTGASGADIPYCLALISLVKDVERIGDYAKNVSEILDVRPEPLPESPLVDELWEVKTAVESAFKTAVDIFQKSDAEAALNHIQKGRDLAHRCDALISKIAQADLSPSVVTALVLGIRFYKRIGGHVLNVLSSVVMPLHKIDYYDEDEVPYSG